MEYKKGNILVYCYDNGNPHYLFEFIEIKCDNYQDLIITGVCVNLTTDFKENSYVLPFNKHLIRPASFAEINEFRTYLPTIDSIKTNYLQIYGI